MKQKIIQENQQYSQRFLNYTNFLCISFCTKVLYCYTYCLQEDSILFGLKVSAQFGLKNQQYLQRFLELYQLFMNNLQWQSAPKSWFYILLKLLTCPSQFCIITHPNLFIFNWVYTTRTNPVLQLNLNYKNY